MKNTGEVILERALELFNEKGIEYGGLRELAKLLDIRVSNITYYYPTKDDLVAAIGTRLAVENTATTEKYDCHSLKNYLEMQREIFLNQDRYRSLFVSFVHVFTHNKVLADNYKETEKKRRKRLEDIFNHLIKAGYLEKETKGEGVLMLVNHLTLIARFSHSEARISYADKTLDEVIYHYFTLICDILRQYATKDGKKDIKAFLREIEPLSSDK